MAWYHRMPKHRRFLSATRFLYALTAWALWKNGCLIKLKAVTTSSEGRSNMSSFLVDISMLSITPNFRASDCIASIWSVCRNIAMKVLQNITFSHGHVICPSESRTRPSLIFRVSLSHVIWLNEDPPRHLSITAY